MGDRAEFLKRIIANPLDDTSRLVFADWLTEHTEWDHEWSDLIRVQCLGLDAPWHVQRWLDKRFCLQTSFPWARAKGTNSEHYEWGAMPYPKGDAVYFRSGRKDTHGRVRVDLVRGMVDTLTCSSEFWSGVAASLYWRPGSQYACPDTAQPIRQVFFTDPDSYAFIIDPERHWPGVEFAYVE